MFKLIKSYKNRPNILVSIFGKPLVKEKSIEIVNVLYNII